MINKNIKLKISDLVYDCTGVYKIISINKIFSKYSFDLELIKSDGDGDYWVPIGTHFYGYLIKDNSLWNLHPTTIRRLKLERILK
jgi:hypothetical protein